MSLILAVTMGSLAIAAQTSITAAGGALLQVEGGVEPEQAEPGIEEGTLGRGKREFGDVAVRFVERRGGDDTRDNNARVERNCLWLLGLRLGNQKWRRYQESDGESHG